MLHEFRHKVQELNPNIGTNVRNNNYEKWIQYSMDNGVDLGQLIHVFHEILPYEIDANTFACEILEIDYPGSKFEITDETLIFLKDK